MKELNVLVLLFCLVSSYKLSDSKLVISQNLKIKITIIVINKNNRKKK
jgi:hypothetical protein